MQHATDARATHAWHARHAACTTDAPRRAGRGGNTQKAVCIDGYNLHAGASTRAWARRQDDQPSGCCEDGTEQHYGTVKVDMQALEGFACQSCTFHNAPGVLECAMCHTPRGAAAGSAASVIRREDVLRSSQLKLFYEKHPPSASVNPEELVLKHRSDWPAFCKKLQRKYGQTLEEVWAEKSGASPLHDPSDSALGSLADRNAIVSQDNQCDRSSAILRQSLSRSGIGNDAIEILLSGDTAAPPDQSEPEPEPEPEPELEPEPQPQPQPRAAPSATAEEGIPPAGQSARKMATKQVTKKVKPALGGPAVQRNNPTGKPGKKAKAKVASPARAGPAALGTGPTGLRANRRKDKKQTKLRRSVEYHPSASDKALAEQVAASMELGSPDQLWQGEPKIVARGSCFEDIAGVDEQIRKLQDAVIHPILLPSWYWAGARKPWKGILMYGPPGTGKTMLAKAVAAECRTTFFQTPDLRSKMVGEGPKLVRVLFEMARCYAPSVIFFDEIDSIASARGEGAHESSDQLKNELIQQWDGANPAGEACGGSSTVLVLGATNRPHVIDEAIRRRLQRRIYIPLPNAVGAEQMFRVALRGLKLDDGVVEALPSLATRLTATNTLSVAPEAGGSTSCYSAADIADVCNTASQFGRTQADAPSSIELLNMRRSQIDAVASALDVPITVQDLERAISQTRGSVAPKTVRELEDWGREYGAE